MELLIAAAADVDSIPYKIGQSLWLVIGLVVIIRQVARMREDNQSKLASLSLILFWSAIGLVSIVGIFFSDPTPVGRMLAGLFAIGTLGLILAAVILAILGWVQVHNQADRNMTGRGTAIWTLCLSAIVLLISGIAVFQKFKSAIDFAVKDQSASVTSSYDKDSDAYQVEDVEHNFRAKLPQTGWTELDVSESNAQISFMATNVRLNAFVMIITEAIGDSEIDLRMVESMVRSRALASQDVTTANTFHDGTIGGRPVRKMELDSIGVGQPLEFQFTLFEEKGMLNQVITYFIGKGSREANASVTEQILQSFEVIDPEFAYRVDSAHMIESISSRLGGMKLPLTEAGWRVWENLANDADYAEDGAIFATNAGLLVMGTHEIGPDLTEQAVQESFLNLMDVEIDSVVGLRKIRREVNGHPCTDYLFEEERSGGMYTFHARVLQEGNIAAAAVGWWPGGPEPDALREAMDRIEFNPASVEESTGYSDSLARQQARLVNRFGLYQYMRSEFDSSRKYFLRAHDLHASDPVYLQNTLRAACEGDLVEEGIAIARERIAQVEGDSLSRALYAVLLSRDNQVEAGVEQMKAALADGFDDSDDLFMIIDSLVDRDQYDAAEEVLRFAMEKRESVKYAIWLAATLRLAGRLEQAEQVILPYMEETPFSFDVAEELVEIKMAQDMASDALEVANQAMEAYPDSVAAVVLKLDALLELDWLTEARETVSGALQQFPDNAELLNYQEWLAGHMGLDDLSIVSKELEPVPLPEGISQLVDAVVAREIPSSWSEREVVYDYRITGYFFEPGQPVRKTIRHRARLHTRRAVENFSTLEFAFDPDIEHLHVQRVEVLDAGGNSIASVNRDLFYLSEQASSEMATEETTLFVPVNGLATDCILEWEVTWEDNSGSDEFPFVRNYLANSYPVGEHLLYVTGSPSGIEAVHRKVEPVQGAGESVKAWQVQDAPGIELESSMPAFAEIFPVVEMGAGGQSWEEVANDYLSDITGELVLDENMAEMVEGLELDELSLPEKVRRLVRLAQDKVVYKALEFGAKARIPDKASVTWTNRYGDCKDLTILIYQLLKAAGIPSHPLLIHTENPLVEELPSLDQFNHMVIFVPGLPGQPVIDLVDTTLDHRYGPPHGLGGRTGLLCDPENPRLLQVDPYPSAWDQPSADVFCEIGKGAAGGMVKVSEIIEAYGYYGSWLRGDYQDLEPKDYLENVQDTLKDYLPVTAELESVEVENVYDASLPLVLRVLYSFQPEGGEFDFHPAWMGHYLDMQPDSYRDQPWQIEYPFAITSRVRFSPHYLDLAPRHDQPVLQAQPLRVDSGIAEIASADRPDNQLKESRFKVGWEATVLPVDDYYGFFDSLERVRRHSKRTFILREAQEEEGTLVAD